MSRAKIGVCSWSLQVGSVPELSRWVDEVGAEVVQIGLGDPNHGTWEEGEGFLDALRASSIELTGTMIGYPGEDYTSPKSIEKTGGFGDPETRSERLDIFRQAVDQTSELGLQILCSHAGFLPEADSPERNSFLDCLREAGNYAQSRGVIFAMETGQETASLLRQTLDDLDCPGLKVNFDPANMILYNMGDPIEAVKILGPDIAHIHVKDASPPLEDGAWGSELPLGEGTVGMEAFLSALAAAGYEGPLVVEREVGNQAERARDIRAGIDLLKRIQAG